MKTIINGMFMFTILSFVFCIFLVSVGHKENVKLEIFLMQSSENRTTGIEVNKNFVVTH